MPLFFEFWSFFTFNQFTPICLSVSILTCHQPISFSFRDFTSFFEIVRDFRHFSFLFLSSWVKNHICILWNPNICFNNNNNIYFSGLLLYRCIWSSTVLRIRMCLVEVVFQRCSVKTSSEIFRKSTGQRLSQNQVADFAKTVTLLKHVKYASRQVLCDMSFPVSEQNLRFCPYAGKRRSKKTHVLVYFTQWQGLHWLCFNLTLYCRYSRERVWTVACNLLSIFS